MFRHYIQLLKNENPHAYEILFKEIIYTTKNTQFSKILNELKLFDYSFHRQNEISTRKISRQQDGSEGKGSCHTSLAPKFNPWNPYKGGSREATLQMIINEHTQLFSKDKRISKYLWFKQFLIKPLDRVKKSYNKLQIFQTE